MNLVIDTNEVFSFFENNPKVRNIILHPDIKLFSPDFVFEELNNLSPKIKRLAGINETEYIFLLGVISGIVEIEGKEGHVGFVEKAKSMISDMDDVPFLALALKLGVDIWSDDKHFKEQSEIEVFTTNDLYKMLFG